MPGKFIFPHKIVYNIERFYVYLSSEMNKQQAILFAFLILIFNISGKAQVNFNIIIDNYYDSSVLLTSYHGDKIKLVDTAYLSDGAFTFSNKNYPGGIYILADPAKKKLFEFIVNNESDFTIYSDSKSLNRFNEENSTENKAFFRLQEIRNSIFNLSKQHSDTNSNLSHTKSIEIEIQLDSLIRLLDAEETELKLNHPDLLISKLIEASKDIQVPDSISIDSIQRYHYYKLHFWDGIDLNDERFIRSPIIDQKLETYFDNIVFLHPDSAIIAIDQVISFARPSDEVVSYLLWFFISKYQNPQYMGFDKVFVHLVDNYFLKEEVLHTTESIIENLKERSYNLKPLLIGELAPDLILMDTNNQFISFRELKSDFTLLLFWDYNCNVCDDEITELKEFLDSTVYEISVYAINTNRNLLRWKDTLHQRKMDWHNVNGTQSITNDFHTLYDINGTPRLFLLDKEKKIIAKHIKVAQLIPIIENQFMKSKL